MKKILAIASALITISASAFAALPPGVFTSQRPLAHHHGMASHRIHVNPSHRMHTPIHNRVRMTPQHRAGGPVGGRMSSTGPHRYHAAPPSHRVYVQPARPVYHYRRPILPPPRWRYAGYYSGHYWRPYSGYVVAYPARYYGGWGYYARPGVRISVRI